MSPDMRVIQSQFCFNIVFQLILDGQADAIIEHLKHYDSVDMRIEITILRRIYEKFLEARPLIEQLKNRGSQIVRSQEN